MDKKIITFKTNISTLNPYIESIRLFRAVFPNPVTGRTQKQQNNDCWEHTHSKCVLLVCLLELGLEGNKTVLEMQLRN